MHDHKRSLLHNNFMCMTYIIEEVSDRDIIKNQKKHNNIFNNADEQGL